MKRTSKITKMLFGGGLILLLIFVLAGHAMAQDCVSQPSDLVSWWPGDGNADDKVELTA